MFSGRCCAKEQVPIAANAAATLKNKGRTCIDPLPCAGWNTGDRESSSRDFIKIIRLAEQELSAAPSPHRASLMMSAPANSEKTGIAAPELLYSETAPNL
jgi:hypothetical protein